MIENHEPFAGGNRSYAYEARTATVSAGGPQSAHYGG